MITYILVSFAILALLLFAVRTVRGHREALELEDLQGYATPVDIVAFRNLVDPEEEEFLRANLRGTDFRRIHRARMLAAAAYVRSTARNASLLLRVGQSVRSSPDPQLAEAATQLVENAQRVRLHSFYVIVQLYGAAMLPGSHVSLAQVIDRYQNLTEVLARVTRLQRPQLTSRIAMVV